ncbi:archaeosine biosynthesis radical SAM protein RaSEA [Thermococcus alcaliphilus]|uniref:archaeosine biosynthesis radical SAM protein RaSEA n=1 Tax=Thermococcus alcaliphilus TaxID=139207 RepID=UPI0020910F2D|nr:archaeosine biosynthesis radical SAM protein RaSEA [Thermococcus alcaliphilus]MCO6041683.1 archaeosine biosynthesis radical SAM protein RaSEA [Thermococcus alcaliphilus]
MTFWTSEDNVAGKKGIALYVILPTIGCYRYRIGEACYMCSYPAEAPKVPWSQEELVKYFKKALKKIEGKNGPIAVRIFTSGSFFDDGEVKRETRRQIFSILAEMDNVEEIVVESRSELVRYDAVRELVEIIGEKYFEVAIGLETANDDIADVSINKGNTFEEFVRASEIIREAGANVKTYLLFKPIFLSERDAIEDVKESIKKAAPYTDTFSINVTNIQRGTIYERLWEKGEYRTPWLWSVVEILKWAKENFPKKRILSDPVGAGSKRGPHNCGKCDKAVAKAIREFSNTQNLKFLENIEHDCLREWEYIVSEGLLDWQLQVW